MRATLLLLLFSISFVASAHPLDPAFLQLRETASGQVSLRWSGSRAFVTGVNWQLPEGCQRLRPDVPIQDQTRWHGSGGWHCTRPISGALLGGLAVIDGNKLLIDYQLQGQVNRRDGVLDVNSGYVYLPEADGSATASLLRFMALGADHIATGIDHLLFILLLLLLFQSRRQLLLAVTAFTLGHSFTLFLCATDMLQISSAWAEACIALSLVVLCRELLQPGVRTSLIATHPWLVTAGFGLIHGLGFASALRDLGMGEEYIVAQVLGFNLGVEIGQLLFIALMLSALALLRRLQNWNAPVASGAAIEWLHRKLLPYSVGMVATFWFWERLAGGLN